jgi:hypothetical protein
LNLLFDRVAEGGDLARLTQRGSHNHVIGADLFNRRTGCGNRRTIFAGEHIPDEENMQRVQVDPGE